MPTLMSQNVVRPEDVSRPECPTVIINGNPIITVGSMSKIEGLDLMYPQSTLYSGHARSAQSAPAASAAQRSQGTRPVLPTIQTSLAVAKSSESPSATTPSPGASQSSNSSPISQIRRWTSSLGSSKKQQQQQQLQQQLQQPLQQPESPSAPKPAPKSLSKTRTIGPISAPQPLTTPAPYACTPLPYFDLLPTPNTPAGPYLCDSTLQIPRSPAKPTTSCPDLSITAQLSDISHTSPLGSVSSLGRGQRTSWKDRLFSSSAKKQDRRASTNSTDDDFDWACYEHEGTAMPLGRSPGRPKVRISAPLTHPTLPPNQKTIPVISDAMFNPMDDHSGLDTLDSLGTGDDALPRSLYDANRSIIDTLGYPGAAYDDICEFRDDGLYGRPPRPISPEQMICASAIETSEHDSTEQQSCSGDAHVDYPVHPYRAAGPELPLPESYFDQVSMNLDVNEPHPYSEKPKKPLRIQIGLHDRASRSLSSYSVSSDSESDSEDSDIDSDDDQSSPISGASFFATPPNTVNYSTSLNPGLAHTLLKSGSIKIPSSLMTFLPSASAKGKPAPASPTTTPPATPPHEHAEVSPKGRSYLGQSFRSPSTSSIPDPRALTLKKLAYNHTSRKMRERKRPFRHVVILNQILARLRRSTLSSKQCNEIGDYYMSMSSNMFSSRLDFNNSMNNLQQQQQQQQQQQGLAPPQMPNPSSSQQQQTAQESVNASPTSPTEQKHESTHVFSRLASKAMAGSKSRKSLVFSFQSKSGSSKSQSINNNNNASESNTESVSPPSTGSAPTQFSLLKDRLRMPIYPLLNLDKKNGSANNTTNHTTIGPIARSPSPSNAILPASLRVLDSGMDSDDSDEEDSVEEEEEEEDEGKEEEEGEDKDENYDEDAEENATQHGGIVSPSPTVILPKRTTGRKGLIYQQQTQQQQQQQQQQSSQGDAPQSQAPFLPRSLIPSDDQNPLNMDPLWIQAQLSGTRPRYASTTFTIVRVNDSEVVTKPLLTPKAPRTPTPTSSTNSSTVSLVSNASTTSTASTSSNSSSSSNSSANTSISSNSSNGTSSNPSPSTSSSTCSSPSSSTSSISITTPPRGSPSSPSPVPTYSPSSTGDCSPPPMVVPAPRPFYNPQPRMHFFDPATGSPVGMMVPAASPPPVESNNFPASLLAASMSPLYHTPFAMATSAPVSNSSSIPMSMVASTMPTPSVTSIPTSTMTIPSMAPTIVPTAYIHTTGPRPYMVHSQSQPVMGSGYMTQTTTVPVPTYGMSPSIHVTHQTISYLENQAIQLARNMAVGLSAPGCESPAKHGFSIHSMSSAQQMQHQQLQLQHQFQHQPMQSMQSMQSLQAMQAMQSMQPMTVPLQSQLPIQALPHSYSQHHGLSQISSEAFMPTSEMKLRNAHTGLPSPPLSPTLESEMAVVTAPMIQNKPKSRNHQRAVSGQPIRVRPASPLGMSGNGGGLMMMKGLETVMSRRQREIHTENMIMARHSLDEHRLLKSSRRFGPIGMGGIGGGNEEGQEEEEDVPLALVQKRLSSDMLRSAI